jgi:hypothetical protein
MPRQSAPAFHRRNFVFCNFAARDFRTCAMQVSEARKRVWEASCKCARGGARAAAISGGAAGT